MNEDQRADIMQTLERYFKHIHHQNLNGTQVSAAIMEAYHIWKVYAKKGDPELVVLDRLTDEHLDWIFLYSKNSLCRLQELILISTNDRSSILTMLENDKTLLLELLK